MRSEAWDKPAFISLPFPGGVLNTVLAACCPLPTMPLYLPSAPPPHNIPHSGAGAAGAGGGDISAGLNSEHAPC